MVYICRFLLLFVRKVYFQTTLNPGGYEIPNITLRIIWPGSGLYQQFDFWTALTDSQPFKRVGCFHGTVDNVYHASECDAHSTEDAWTGSSSKVAHASWRISLQTPSLKMFSSTSSSQTSWTVSKSSTESRTEFS